MRKQNIIKCKAHIQQAVETREACGKETQLHHSSNIYHQAMTKLSEIRYSESQGSADIPWLWTLRMFSASNKYRKRTREFGHRTITCNRNLVCWRYYPSWYLTRNWQSERQRRTHAPGPTKWHPNSWLLLLWSEGWLETQKCKGWGKLHSTFGKPTQKLETQQNKTS